MLTCKSPIFCSKCVSFCFKFVLKKAIWMAIFVLRVINSSRHRNSLVVCLARSGFHKSNSWIQPRTPHFLWRKLYVGGSRRIFFLCLYNNFKLIPSQPKTTQRLVEATKLAPSISHSGNSRTHLFWIYNVSYLIINFCTFENDEMRTSKLLVILL